MNDMKIWEETLLKIVIPPLTLFSENRFYEWEIEVSPKYHKDKNKHIGYLECISRITCGISYYVYNQKNEKLKALLVSSINNIVNSNNSIYQLWFTEQQSLIEAGHLAYGFIRSNMNLFNDLDENSRKNCIKIFKYVKNIKTNHNNWILYNAMIEYFLYLCNEEYHVAKIQIILNQVENWYVGDGFYKDGNSFKMDYYNSYVIHSFYYDISKEFQNEKIEELYQRMKLYSKYLTNLISPCGYYPPLGRSITYRFATFHCLSHFIILKNEKNIEIDKSIKQKLTNVIKFLFWNNDSFDENGFLKLGWANKGAEISDYYTNSGSLYATTLGFFGISIIS